MKSVINDRKIKLDVINGLIEKLEEIKDDQIDSIEIVPYQEVNSYELINGEKYALLETLITIKHKRIYKKGTINDDFLYKAIN